MTRQAAVFNPAVSRDPCGWNKNRLPSCSLTYYGRKWVCPFLLPMFKEQELAIDPPLGEGFYRLTLSSGPVLGFFSSVEAAALETWPHPTWFYSLLRARCWLGLSLNKLAKNCPF
jgi:hypothetical protein